MVLLVWEHKNIPREPGVENVPEWHGDDFANIWATDFIQHKNKLIALNCNIVSGKIVRNKEQPCKAMEQAASTKEDGR